MNEADNPVVTLSTCHRACQFESRASASRVAMVEIFGAGESVVSPLGVGGEKGAGRGVSARGRRQGAEQIVQ